jgi:hypothetical protein
MVRTEGKEEKNKRHTLQNSYSRLLAAGTYAIDVISVRDCKITVETDTGFSVNFQISHVTVSE